MGKTGSFAFGYAVDMSWWFKRRVRLCRIRADILVRTHTLPQSPELAGGAGFTFEGAVAALYLASLLEEAHAPGVEDRTVVRVAVQQRDFGEPLDDIIVDFRGADGEEARLSLQAKRALTISSAVSNTDFRDIIRDAWATRSKTNFRSGVDRYGAAVGEVAMAKARALTTLCELARESPTAAQFDDRFAPGGNVSVAVRTVREDIARLLGEAGSSCTPEEVHGFLAHFVLIEFDFLHAGAGDPPRVISSLADCLDSSEVSKAPLLWSRLVVMARQAAGRSGVFDRPRLVRDLAQLVRLRAVRSLRGDIEILTALSRSYLESIQDDVGGTRLDRPGLTDKLVAKLKTARLVQIRGLPGSGKSVLLRQNVARALDAGPVLFLKADQLEGRSWISFAAAHSLSAGNLEALLVEVGATGHPVLYLDAIDRIEKAHQPVVLDVLRTIVASPLLEDWRVVVTLRDTGIEPLRNWMGDVVEALQVDTVAVDALDDDDCRTLAAAKPHLEDLLFGAARVRDIVRRPFFAKVLDQSFVAAVSDPPFSPQSEVDLVGNWWLRGGYNATGQNALERQRALVELAARRARHLSVPIGLRHLSAPTVGLIDQLVADGILQHVRPGLTVRFSHDIFFEWGFFHVLADVADDWLAEIRACGEPPAAARVVELFSQWEYAQGDAWAQMLDAVASSGMRSQWTRAWLLGPIAASTFEGTEDRFAAAVLGGDKGLLKKALVWFQAEKTTPNPGILSGDLPQDQRLRVADLLGWPADFMAWRRLITFVLIRLPEIPLNQYPDVLSVFEVWQNALSDLRNPLSHSVLAKCAEWLEELDASAEAKTPDARTSHWDQVPDLGDFHKSLARVILKAARSEPGLAEDYLKRVIASERLRSDKFEDIVAFAPLLATTHAGLLVELTLKHLMEELPDDKAAREREEAGRAAERRRKALAKPEAERTREDNFAIQGLFSVLGVNRFSYHDFETLSIDRDTRNFYPPSPLREPFRSLFASAPDEALHLLREACHHAMTAWRQLHHHLREERGTPLPLELDFPWGRQTFWGGDREYLWYRTIWAPKPLACGFMALEEWGFGELERGRPVDDLIRQIVEGNDCIAVLGIAVLFALQTDRVSETVFPLVTSQWLLSADHNRMVQDYSAKLGNLMGFTGSDDRAHADAVRASGERAVRKKRLQELIPRYVFSGDDFSARTRSAIAAFVQNLPYQLDEHRGNPAARDDLTAKAIRFAELADPANYTAYKTEEPDQIALVHESPSASSPEVRASALKAETHLRETSLWMWASKAFETGVAGQEWTVPKAVTAAQSFDSKDLFDRSKEPEDLGTRPGAVAATAAVALRFREDCGPETLKWARQVLDRAARTPETRDAMWTSSAIIPWHQAIFAARGLAADLKAGTADRNAVPVLLSLVGHPLEAVSLAAVEEACGLWEHDARLGWAALHVAFSLCHIPPRPRGRGRDAYEPVHTPGEVRAAVGAAEIFCRKGTGWPDLPGPPTAWVKLTGVAARRGGHRADAYDDGDVRDPADVWGDPPGFWNSHFAARILPILPIESMLATSARSAVLDFAGKLLSWTNEKNAPPWVKPGRRNRDSSRLFEWTHALGEALGRLSGFLAIEDARPLILEPIFALEGDNCWALLSPFTSTYVCRYVYDAASVPDNAVDILGLCLDRFLKAPPFQRGGYRRGDFSGFDQPKLLRTLMFVSVERADLAARYVNGDWSEISRILPLVDRLVRAGGWAASVIGPFLTLCDRARTSYPAEAFADQVLAVVGPEGAELKGWHGTIIPARIAGLVQHFVDRDTPMPPGLAQKFLRILDLLVDMGDRRSAALQLSEIFREVRVHT